MWAVYVQIPYLLAPKKLTVYIRGMEIIFHVVSSLRGKTSLETRRKEIPPRILHSFFISISSRGINKFYEGGIREAKRGRGALHRDRRYTGLVFPLWPLRKAHMISGGTEIASS